MKKNDETFFTAIGGLNDELLDREIERSIRENDKAREETAKSATELCPTGETSAPRPHRKLLGIGLIAAVLVVLFLVGAFASNVIKGKTDRIIPASFDYPAISATDFERDEEFTEDVLIERMLNSVDYFNTASIKFTYTDSLDLVGIQEVTIDTNIDTSKAYERIVCREYDLETISDGKSVYSYNHTNNTLQNFGSPIRRQDELKDYLENTPRHEVGENSENYWNSRMNITNADYATHCLVPQHFTFGFLNPDNAWEISGETEYLGRKCVEITGVSTGYGEKWGVTHFTMCVDKKTGILFKLEGYDNEGNCMLSMIVSEAYIDQPEITDTNLDEKIVKFQTAYNTRTS